MQRTVLAEAGDSWFNWQKLKLPPGCCYEFQLNYWSIGWSVAATLGYAQASPDKQLISCIGDGSFQLGFKFRRLNLSLQLIFRHTELQDNIEMNDDMNGRGKYPNDDSNEDKN
ncbi:hypothetical protein M0R45_018918 [Rubus argutus]|uniref:pyruvate decarboxylase n=1 Tax=Rubus argutus TaxID=59490 RepID=A0AAW1X6K7_RUBAR